MIPPRPPLPSPPQKPVVINVSAGDTVIIDGIPVTIQRDGVYEIRGYAARVTLVARIGADRLAELTKGEVG